MNSSRILSRFGRNSILLKPRVRLNSTQAPKPVSPHVSFYKVYARPVGKVLLMSVFVYQLAYLGWFWLEKDEIKSQKTVQLKELEKQLEDLTNDKTKATKP